MRRSELRTQRPAGRDQEQQPEEVGDEAGDDQQRSAEQDRKPSMISLVGRIALFELAPEPPPARRGPRP